MTKPSGDRAILSKSTFIRGLQCEKSLYLHKNRPFLRDRLSPEQLAKFSRGTDVGVYAWDLFPGGVDASPKTHFQMAASVKKTAAFIEAGEKVIYEAAFEHEGVVVALDILVKEDLGWKAIEVKSSRAISDTYLWDASLQYYVIRGAGLELVDFSIAYIDQAFIKDGPVQPEKLFILENVLPIVLDRQGVVGEKIVRLKEVIPLKNSPKIPIGPQCHDPYPCDFIGHCWKKVPAGSVFELKCLDEEQKFRYFENGIVQAADLPEEELDELSLRQIQSIALGKELADRDKLSDFLGQVKQPVSLFSWLDFKPAIPIFEGTKPYQPIHYSLAWQNPGKGNEETEIYSAPAFPGEETLMRLVDILARTETILVFGVLPDFEVLFQMTKGGTVIQGKFKNLLDKAIDISSPFSDGTIVWPQMVRAFTPEDILQSMGKPVITPAGKIKTRLEAALAIEKLARGNVEEDSETVLRDIEAFHSARLSNLLNLFRILEKLVQ
ncbi:MAG: DUF2779 domain-containing protein [Bacteroides sp.]|jgi:hypothetical protein|nr:DUF2779 domain-containing protein [Bacteroides sp.]